LNRTISAVAQLEILRGDGLASAGPLPSSLPGWITGVSRSRIPEPDQWVSNGINNLELGHPGPGSKNMITYLYWIIVVGLALAIIFFVGLRTGNAKGGLLGAAAVLLVGWTAYYFYFEQVFVKRWGGVMALSVPEGQYHIMTTWKDDNLWIENFDPRTNECIFTEYSRGNLLQGRVTLRNCNPVVLFPSSGSPRSEPSAPTAEKNKPAAP
jgi:hypothetical protein